MRLIYIDEKYTDFLREYDARVSYNKNTTYQRPFIGVLLNIGEMEYFAPLTSSFKGKKLKDNPKPESTTFFPIKKCELGGVNFNNMIPVVKSVYWFIDTNIYITDTPKLKSEKIKLLNIIRFLRKNKNKIIIKAKKIYNLQITNKLYANYKDITCDFKLLEEKAIMYL